MSIYATIYVKSSETPKSFFGVEWITNFDKELSPKEATHKLITNVPWLNFSEMKQGEQLFECLFELLVGCDFLWYCMDVECHDESSPINDEELLSVICK